MSNTPDLREISPLPDEIMQVISWFSKREAQWKRWALVPAGNMIF
jgi:hypothetical protein